MIRRIGLLLSNKVHRMGAMQGIVTIKLLERNKGRKKNCVEQKRYFSSVDRRTNIVQPIILYATANLFPSKNSRDAESNRIVLPIVSFPKGIALP